MREQKADGRGGNEGLDVVITLTQLNSLRNLPRCFSMEMFGKVGSMASEQKPDTASLRRPIQ